MTPACPTTVRLKMAGRFRTGQGRAWLPFTAEEYYTTAPPGFVWAATMRLARVLPLTGRDKYVHGHGALDFGLLSLIPVAGARGPEPDRGALLRYLNEIMWFPAAALSAYIAWEPVDAHAARATMTYRGVSAPATFTCDDAGDLTTMVAERHRAVDGGFALETRSTPLSDYGQFDGVRVPVAGEGSGGWSPATSPTSGCG